MAGPLIGKAYIGVEPQTSPGQFARETERQVRPALQGMIRAGVGLLAGGAFLSTLRRGVDLVIAEGEEARKTLAGTEAIIKATGGSAKVTTEEVSALAESLSQVIGQDDELIQQGANLILTFKQVRNEVGEGNDIFDRAVAASADLGAVFGSLESGALQLGKALEDPVRGILALRRSGVSFTSAQQEMIKSLVESGDLLSAQRLILDEVESQVGGAAAAMATPIDHLRVSIANLAETVGTAAGPVIDLFANTVTLVAGTLQTLPEPLRSAAVGIAFFTGLIGVARVGVGLLTANLAAMGISMGGSAAATGAQTATLATHVAALTADAAASSRAAFSQAGLGTATAATTVSIEAQTAAALTQAGVFGSVGAAAGGLLSTLTRIVGLGAIEIAVVFTVTGFVQNRLDELFGDEEIEAPTNYAENLQFARQNLGLFGRDVSDTDERMQSWNQTTEEATEQWKANATAAELIPPVYDSATRAIIQHGAAMDDTMASASALAVTEEDLAAIEEARAKAAEDLAEIEERSADADKERTQVLRELAGVHREVMIAAQQRRLAELSLAGGLLGIQSASLQAQQAQQDLRDARFEEFRLERAGREGTRRYRDALGELQGAQLGAVQGQLGLAQAVAQYIAENQGSNASTGVAIDLIEKYGAAAGLTGGEVQALITDVLGLIEQYRKLPDREETVVEFRHEEALRRIRELNRALDGIPTKVEIEAEVRGTGTTSTGATTTSALSYEDAVSLFRNDPTLTNPTPKVEVKLSGRTVQSEVNRTETLIEGG